jgi:hypothetical protein
MKPYSVKGDQGEEIGSEISFRQGGMQGMQLIRLDPNSLIRRFCSASAKRLPAAMRKPCG